MAYGQPQSPDSVAGTDGQLMHVASCLLTQIRGQQVAAGWLHRNNRVPMPAMQRTLLAGSGCLSSSYPTSQKRGTCRDAIRHPGGCGYKAQQSLHC